MDGAVRHIRSLDGPTQKPDKLPANTGILPDILSRILCLGQIACLGVVMRFQIILNDACDYVCSFCRPIFNRISKHFL